jgi:hypothetical protein
MLQTVSRLLPELPLYLMIAVATHLVMSFAQALMHCKPVCTVQTVTGTALRSSPPRELQFRGDPFLLG